MTSDQPTFDAYIEPLLRLLADHPDGLPTSDVYEKLADRLELTDAERGELLPSGRQPVYQNRIGWAHDRLKRAGISESVKRGTWALTKGGRRLVQQYEDLPREHLNAISRPRNTDFELAAVLGTDNEALAQRNADVPATPESSSDSFTAMEAAKIVLADADEPLHYREITRRILDRDLWQTDGKTPADSISAGMSVDIKKHGDASDFVRTKRGYYRLNRNGLEPESEHAEDGGSPPEDKNPRSYDPISFTDAAERVLQVFGNHEPMHYSEITERALDLRLIVTESQAPSASMYSSLSQETKRRKERGDTPRFELHGDGMVGLTRWNQTGLTAYIEAHNDKIRRRFHHELHEMDPAEFEELIGQLLISLGFEEVEVTSRHNDGGIDVRGTLVVGDVIRTRMAVQVKRWKSNVQTPEVQKVRGSLGSHEQGLIITTSDFSSGARVEAERPDAVPVGLMDGEQLVRLLVEHGLGVEKDELNLLRMG